MKKYIIAKVSSSLKGLLWENETNNSNETQHKRIETGSVQAWLKDLNLRWAKSKPPSSQAATWTGSLQVTSLTLVYIAF